MSKGYAYDIGRKFGSPKAERNTLDQGRVTSGQARYAASLCQGIVESVEAVPFKAPKNTKYQQVHCELRRVLLYADASHMNWGLHRGRWSLELLVRRDGFDR